jgi:putative FmdB family regulatory protein
MSCPRPEGDPVPTYQYSCTECGHFFEKVQSFSEDSLTVCPQCEGRLRKVFNAVGVVFKGSGFYRTDSRADSRADGATATAGAGDGGSAAGSSDGAAKKGAGSGEKAGSGGSPGGGATGGSSGGSSSATKTASGSSPSAA